MAIPGAIRLIARNGMVTGDGQIAPKATTTAEQAVDKPQIAAAAP